MHKTQSDSSTERLMHRKLLYCVYCVDDQWMSHVNTPSTQHCRAAPLAAHSPAPQLALTRNHPHQLPCPVKPA